MLRKLFSLLLICYFNLNTAVSIQFEFDNYHQDLDHLFPTLDREELNLSIGPMALSVAEVGDFTREYGTYIGDIKVSQVQEENLNDSHHPFSSRLTLIKFEVMSTSWTRITSTSESSVTMVAAL